MGADLLTARLWQPAGRTIDWEAGLRAAGELSEEACGRLLEQLGGWFEDEQGEEPEVVRQRAVTHVETMREHFEGYSRVLDTFDTPDGRWTCWLTGGMSWGDSPSELYDAINDLYVVPRGARRPGLLDRRGEGVMISSSRGVTYTAEDVAARLAYGHIPGTPQRAVFWLARGDRVADPRGGWITGPGRIEIVRERTNVLRSTVTNPASAVTGDRR